MKGLGGLRTLKMDKLTSYLLHLYEQAPTPKMPPVREPATPKPIMTYQPQVDIAKIKSKANLDKAKCFQLKCQSAVTKYDTMFCKYGCIKDLALGALQSIRGLLSNCTKAKNPRQCQEYIKSVAITIQKKLDDASAMQERSKDLANQARINKQRGIGVEKNAHHPIGSKVSSGN